MQDKYSLSICIPSNRNLEESKRSISSAIGFCENTQSELVVSDNSGDKQKDELWSKVPLSFLKFLPFDNKGSGTWIDNWYNGITNCSGKFVGIVSDDDLIIDINSSEVEYKDINEEDLIGIKPAIPLWNKSTGIYKINNFNIDANTAKERIIQYYKNASGNNTTYYSFYRKSDLNDIFSLLLNHPTKGGYIDWAITISLVATGKVLVDSSKMLIYRNTNWFGDAKYIENQARGLYEQCNLKKNSFFYQRVFRAIDCFILIMRKNSRIATDEKIEAAEFVLNENLTLFFKDFKDNIDKFEEHEKNEIKKINIETNIETKLNYILNILYNHMPSLKEDYEKFYKVSIGKNWGDFF